jgi:hypothetical protein
MTYCAGCRKSKNSEDLVGAVRGEFVRFDISIFNGDKITLYFCKDCWEDMKAKGIVPF